MSATASPVEGAPSSSGNGQRVRVWDLPLRLFHWLLVIAVAVAFLSSEEDSPINQWHILAGWIAGILIVFRVAWGLVGGEHSRFADFIRPAHVGEHISGLFRKSAEKTLGHNPLGGVAVVVMLALVAGTVWTGAFGGEKAEDFHELIAWTLLALVGLHVTAVVVMSVLQRENLVAAMITGTKPRALHAGARNAKRPSLVGLFLALLVLAGTIYGVLQYDPKAFTLRRAESFEQRGATSLDASAPSRREQED